MAFKLTPNHDKFLLSKTDSPILVRRELAQTMIDLHIKYGDRFTEKFLEFAEEFPLKVTHVVYLVEADGLSGNVSKKTARRIS